MLAVSIENGYVLLLKQHDDVSPTRVNTGLCPLCLEWSNSRELLSVAGTVPNTEFTNMVKVYTHTGILLYTAMIPYTQVGISNVMLYTIFGTHIAMDIPIAYGM